MMEALHLRAAYRVHLEPPQGRQHVVAKVALIGLTPMDLYAHDRDWFFQMAYVNYSAQSRAVVSTYRMHLGIFRPADDERVFSRARKLVTKYIGLMVYDLTLNDDPTSPMFGNVLSVWDLDEMQEPLFVP